MTEIPRYIVKDLNFFDNWKIEKSNDSDFEYLNRKTKVFNGMEIDNNLCQYKCVNLKTGISYFLYDIKEINDVSSDKKKIAWNYIGRTVSEEYKEVVHLIHSFHYINKSEDFLKREYYPNIFIGDRIVHNGICLWDPNTSGSTECIVKEECRLKKDDFRIAMLLLGYFFQNYSEGKDFRGEFPEELKKIFVL